MEAAARAATRFPVDRDQHAMTRHGMIQLSAAGAQPPATDRSTSVVMSAPTEPRPAAHRPDNTARRRNEAVCPHSPQPFPTAVAPSLTSAEIRNPHSHRLWPAGSFLGDFRTPAGARNSSRKKTDSFWSRKCDGSHSAQLDRHLLNKRSRFTRRCSWRPPARS